jgi:hypothetical protein
MRLFFLKSLLGLAILISTFSCTRDSIEPIFEECVDEITYTSNVRSIINSSCAYSGCHSGTAPGDFTSYAGMVPFLENGKFRKMTILEQSMPPADATEGPSFLTDEQINILFCWAEGGYLEN